jgi:hypothetical protein
VCNIAHRLITTVFRSPWLKRKRRLQHTSAWQSYYWRVQAKLTRITCEQVALYLAADLTPLGAPSSCGCTIGAARLLRAHAGAHYHGRRKCALGAASHSVRIASAPDLQAGRAAAARARRRVPQ